MPRQYKINKERCNKCLYQMNISSGYGNNKNTGKMCGYLLITGDSRCFKDGGYREDYRPGYCQVYKKRDENKRLVAAPISSDHMLVERKDIYARDEKGLH